MKPVKRHFLTVVKNKPVVALSGCCQPVTTLLQFVGCFGNLNRVTATHTVRERNA